MNTVTIYAIIILYRNNSGAEQYYIQRRRVNKNLSEEEYAGSYID
ncbi:hypothetical protein D081_0375 [Anaerovibrio sp. JC8]|nr:hypothetical protein D081_0375 [Anaerovibrio sp. JC8]